MAEGQFLVGGQPLRVASNALDEETKRMLARFPDLSTMSTSDLAAQLASGSVPSAESPSRNIDPQTGFLVDERSKIPLQTPEEIVEEKRERFANVSIDPAQMAQAEADARQSVLDQQLAVENDAAAAGDVAAAPRPGDELRSFAKDLLQSSGQAPVVPPAESERLRDIQAKQEQREQLFQETSKKLEEESNALREKEIDPGRFVREKSLPNKIGTALSLVMGSIGSAITGGENAALKIFNRAIDADINAQKEALSSEKGLLAARETRLGRLQSELGNLSAAEDAERGLLLRSAELQARQQAAQTANKVQAAKIFGMADNFDLQAHKLLKSSAAKSIDAIIAVEDAKAIARAEREKSRDLVLFKGAAPSTDQLNTMNTAITNTNKIISAVNDIDRLVAKGTFDAGVLKGMSESGKKILSRVNQLKTIFGQQLGLGTLQPSDLDFMADVVGDPLAFKEFMQSEAGIRIRQAFREDVISLVDDTVSNFGQIKPEVRDRWKFGTK
jgi:hypothetical protein